MYKFNHETFYKIWDKLFKNGASENCRRQPL